MSKIEEIYRLLDERGIKYHVYDEDESSVAIAFGWTDQHDDYRNQICVFGDSFISATRSYLTPEQAVEATSGREMCHNISEPPEEGFWPMPHFECSVCGAYYVTSDYVYFCPSCGRRVIEDVQPQP